MKFNINSPVIQFINTLYEFIVLNILFLFCCIPIFTIGASLSSLYQVTLQEARGEHGLIIAKFFKSFKENFITSTISFFVYIIVGSILLFNIFFWAAFNTIIATIILTIVSFISLIFVISFLYTFPLIARFKNTTKQTLKNSYIISTTHKIRTLAILAITVITGVLFYYIPIFRFFMMIFGFAFIAYCNSFIFTKTFKEYE